MPASVHIISDNTARVGSVFRLLCEEGNGVGEGNARGLGFLVLCEPRSVLCSLPSTQALRFRDYRWLHVINFLAFETEFVWAWAMPSHVPSERIVPADVTVGPPVTAIPAWAAVCPGAALRLSKAPVMMGASRSRLGSALSGWLLSTTRAQPCQLSFQPRLIHQAWRQCSWDQQWMMGIPVWCERRTAIMSRIMSWP